MRVGIGYDIHKLVHGRPLRLGGVEIPYSRGLMGHSDGDVLIHAICDALLGASNLGDIGGYFPDTDPRYRDIQSVNLLKEVSVMVKKKDLAVKNVDSVVIMEEPKLNPFFPTMKKRVSSILEISAEDISIKATTNEGIGLVGTKEAVAAFAVVILHPIGEPK